MANDKQHDHLWPLPVSVEERVLHVEALAA